MKDATLGFRKRPLVWPIKRPRAFCSRRLCVTVVCEHRRSTSPNLAWPQGSLCMAGTPWACSRHYTGLPMSLWYIRQFALLPSPEQGRLGSCPPPHVSALCHRSSILFVDSRFTWLINRGFTRPTVYDSPLMYVRPRAQFEKLRHELDHDSRSHRTSLGLNQGMVWTDARSRRFCDIIRP